MSEGLTWPVTGIDKAQARCELCSRPITRLKDIARHSHNIQTGCRTLRCSKCVALRGAEKAAEVRMRLGLA